MLHSTFNLILAALFLPNLVTFLGLVWYSAQYRQKWNKPRLGLRDLGYCVLFSSIPVVAPTVAFHLYKDSKNAGK